MLARAAELGRAALVGQFVLDAPSRRARNMERFARGDICAFSSADRLAASTGGLVPATRDSGKRVGNDRFLSEVATGA
jgi:hypothetical protein